MQGLKKKFPDAAFTAWSAHHSGRTEAEVQGGAATPEIAVTGLAPSFLKSWICLWLFDIVNGDCPD